MAAGLLGWEAAFRAAFDTSLNGMALVGEDRCIVFANDAFVALLGRPREEIVGKSVFAHMPPEQHADSDRDYRELRESGQLTGRRTLMRGDGARIECEYAAAMTETPDHGTLALYVVIDARVPDVENPSDGASSEPLTPREAEVVRLVALGHTSTEIANELTVSPETVRTHVRNAMEKTDTHTRAALVAAAFARKLI